MCGSDEDVFFFPSRKIESDAISFNIETEFERRMRHLRRCFAVLLSSIVGIFVFPVTNPLSRLEEEEDDDDDEEGKEDDEEEEYESRTERREERTDVLENQG